MADAEGPVYYEVDGQLVDAWGRPAPEAEGDDSADYSTWSAKELKAEIDRRNENRDEEDQIVLDDNKKSTAAAALKADDEAHADDDEE